MAEAGDPPMNLRASCSQPVYSVPVYEHGRWSVRCFTSEEEADSALADIAARRVAGAWADLDWEELAGELDRIRHATPPTPPIDSPDL